MVNNVELEVEVRFNGWQKCKLAQRFETFTERNHGLMRLLAGAKRV